MIIADAVIFGEDVQAMTPLATLAAVVGLGVWQWLQNRKPTPNMPQPQPGPIVPVPMPGPIDSRMLALLAVLVQAADAIRLMYAPALPPIKMPDGLVPSDQK
jgi:hypothetical protein